MLEQYLSASRILTGARADSLEEAVLLCGGLLTTDGAASEHYPQAMLETVRELGPYAVMAPGVAVPHARPDRGGLFPAVALVFLREPIPFESSNGPVRVIAGFCGVDDESHMALLSALIPLISNRALLESAAAAKTPEEVLLHIKAGL